MQPQPQAEPRRTAQCKGEEESHEPVPRPTTVPVYFGTHPWMRTAWRGRAPRAC